MYKKILRFTVILVIVIMMSGVIFASAPFKLIVNNEEIKVGGSLEVVNGELVIPLNLIGKAFGANVKWNKDTNLVSINTPDTGSLEKRIEQLEAALAPDSSRKAAEWWIEGVKLRNAALQYAVLAPSLRAQKKEDFENIEWKIPGSSPWIESYTIGDAVKNENNQLEYEIKCEYTDSTRMKESKVFTVVVQKFDQNWYIVEEK